MTKQTEAQNSWNEIRAKLLEVLRKGSELSFKKGKLSLANKEKYFVSGEKSFKIFNEICNNY